MLTVIERRLLMIPLDGGAARTVAALDSGTAGNYYIPRLLPGGRSILIGHRHNPDSVSLLQMDLSTGQAEQVHPNVQEVRPYAPDRLLWLDAEGRLRYGTYNQRTRRFGERQLVLAEGIDDLFANGDVVVMRPGLPKRDLWLLAGDAREPSRLAVTDTSASFPLFSPDGSKLALFLTPVSVAGVARRTTHLLRSLQLQRLPQPLPSPPPLLLNLQPRRRQLQRQRHSAHQPADGDNVLQVLCCGEGSLLAPGALDKEVHRIFRYGVFCDGSLGGRVGKTLHGVKIGGLDRQGCARCNQQFYLWRRRQQRREEGTSLRQVLEVIKN
jgi:hypothetical protein